MKLLNLERRLRVSVMMCINNLRKGTKRTESGSSQWRPVTDHRQCAQTETQEVPLEYQEMLTL